MSVLFRRGLLGGTAALVTGVTAGSSGMATSTPPVDAPHPDAELLAACAEFDRLQREYRACAADENDDMTVSGPRIEAAQETLLETIVYATATTEAGHAARARSYLLWQDLDPQKLVTDGDDGERILGALLMDIIGDEPAKA